MTAQELEVFWKDGANEAWKTVEALVEKKRFAHALFFCHLTLEKLLKARYIEAHQKPAPPTHDLIWLLDQSKVTLSAADREVLAEISKFNIAGRYEDYKLELHKQATEEYTRSWIGKTADLRDKLTQ